VAASAASTFLVFVGFRWIQAKVQQWRPMAQRAPSLTTSSSLPAGAPIFSGQAAAAAASPPVRRSVTFRESSPSNYSASCASESPMSSLQFRSVGTAAFGREVLSDDERRLPTLAAGFPASPPEPLSSVPESKAPPMASMDSHPGEADRHVNQIEALLALQPKDDQQERSLYAALQSAASQAEVFAMSNPGAVSMRLQQAVEAARGGIPEVQRPSTLRLDQSQAAPAPRAIVTPKPIATHVIDNSPPQNKPTWCCCPRRR